MSEFYLLFLHFQGEPRENSIYPQFSTSHRSNMSYHVRCSMKKQARGGNNFYLSRILRKAIITTYRVQVHPYIYSKYLWGDLVIEYQYVRLFEISTIFVKLILHYVENVHFHTLICGNTLGMFDEQKVERTNPWIVSGQCTLGAVHGIQELECACLPMNSSITSAFLPKELIFFF